MSVRYFRIIVILSSTSKPVDNYRYVFIKPFFNIFKITFISYLNFKTESFSCVGNTFVINTKTGNKLSEFSQLLFTLIDPIMIHNDFQRRRTAHVRVKSFLKWLNIYV